MNANDRDEEWAALLRCGLSGDAYAHSEFLRRVASKLRGFVRAGLTRAGMGTAEVEDVVQEALLAIHAKRHTWRDGDPVMPWVYAIARYKLIDAIRRRGRRAEVDISDLAETLAQEEVETGPSPIEVERALATLSRGQRAVVAAITVAGYSIKEAAGHLGMSEGAVRVALHRGLEALSANFGKS